MKIYYWKNVDNILNYEFILISKHQIKTIESIMLLIKCTN